MGKHIQNNSTNCLGVFDYFVGLAIKGYIDQNRTNNLRQIFIRTIVQNSVTFQKIGQVEEILNYTKFIC